LFSGHLILVAAAPNKEKHKIHLFYVPVLIMNVSHGEHREHCTVEACNSQLASTLSHFCKQTYHCREGRGLRLKMTLETIILAKIMNLKIAQKRLPDDPHELSVHYGENL
jgi:hypothetical protein